MSMLYTFAGSLQVHMKFHSGEKPFKCTQCIKAFTRLFILQRHTKTHSAHKYTCTICEKSFSQVDHLQTHINNHNEESIKRLKQRKEPVTETATVQNHETVPKETESYSCSQCEKSFDSSYTLEKHKMFHSRVKLLHKCTNCAKTFIKPSMLKRHMMFHNKEKTHSCSECSKTFYDLSTLKAHMRTHTGQKPFNCTKCEKSFRQAGTLQKHMNMHNKDEHLLKDLLTEKVEVPSIRSFPDMTTFWQSFENTQKK